MGSLSLGRPKWEGALGPKVAQEGRAPGGASWKPPQGALPSWAPLAQVLPPTWAFQVRGGPYILNIIF